MEYQLIQYVPEVVPSEVVGQWTDSWVGVVHSELERSCRGQRSWLPTLLLCTCLVLTSHY